LAWNLDIVKLGVVELDEVAAALVQLLESRSSVQTLFVTVTPDLQPADILAQLRCVPHEVLFDRDLPRVSLLRILLAR
jgi:hypothetical protein